MSEFFSLIGLINFINVKSSIRIQEWGVCSWNDKTILRQPKEIELGGVRLDDVNAASLWHLKLRVGVPHCACVQEFAVSCLNVSRTKLRANSISLTPKTSTVILKAQLRKSSCVR